MRLFLLKNFPLVSLLLKESLNEGPFLLYSLVDFFLLHNLLKREPFIFLFLVELSFEELRTEIMLLYEKVITAVYLVADSSQNFVSEFFVKRNRLEKLNVQLVSQTLRLLLQLMNSQVNHPFFETRFVQEKLLVFFF